MTGRRRLMLAAAVLVLVFAAGYATGRATAPVCHSVTEDSAIADCDYRGGGWHPGR